MPAPRELPIYELESRLLAAVWAQGRGWGRRMFAAWTELAASRGASGVHLGVAKENQNPMGF